MIMANWSEVTPARNADEEKVKARSKSPSMSARCCPFAVTVAAARMSSGHSDASELGPCVSGAVVVVGGPVVGGGVVGGDVVGATVVDGVETTSAESDGEHDTNARARSTT